MAGRGTTRRGGAWLEQGKDRGMAWLGEARRGQSKARNME